MQGIVIPDFLLFWMLCEIWNNPKNSADNPKKN